MQIGIWTAGLGVLGSEGKTASFFLRRVASEGSRWAGRSPLARQLSCHHLPLYFHRHPVSQPSHQYFPLKSWTNHSRLTPIFLFTFLCSHGFTLRAGSRSRSSISAGAALSQAHSGASQSRGCVIFGIKTPFHSVIYTSTFQYECVSYVRDF